MTDRKRLVAEALSAHSRTFESVRRDLPFRNSETTLVSKTVIDDSLDPPHVRDCAQTNEIKRHELVYDMLDGRKTGKRSRQGHSGAGALKRGPRGAMIDWTAVFATLPEQFTLDSLLAHKTGGARRPEHISGR